MKRHVPLRSRIGLKPGKPPRRKTRMKRSNPRRKRERFKRAYLSVAYVGFIRWTGCVVPGCTMPPDVAHRKSRGAGGTWEDCFGCCRIHHREQHGIGVAAFERKYRISLEAICARNVMEWRASTKPDESRETARPHQRGEG